MPGTTIVIPCYNEAERLDVVAFQDFVAKNPEIRFLMVDDGSKDKTGEVLEQLQSHDPERLGVVALEKNGGKAEAVRQGMVQAIQEGANIVGFWDADLATPLEVVPEFVKILEEQEGLESVFGSRVQLMGRKIERKMKRHYMGRIFATWAGWMLGLRIYDTQCGAKLFRVNDRVKRYFVEPFLSGWIFDVEILARMIKARRDDDQAPAMEHSVYEFPLMAWRDVGGSKVRGRDAWRAMIDLMRIRRKYLKG